MAPKAYSSLFTAGLFSLGNRAGSTAVTATATSKAVPSPISTTTPLLQPSITLRPPLSPARKTDPSPRRRRKSSTAIGSSPMAAIKSPVHRAQFSHRSAQRSHGIIVTSPAAILFPTVPETQTLTRARRGRPAPPKQKPAPDAPLPSLPMLPLSDSSNVRPLMGRRDSETLPLPSPGLYGSFPRGATTPSGPGQPLGFGSLLAPSPVIGEFNRQRSGSIAEEKEEEDQMQTA